MSLVKTLFWDEIGTRKLQSRAGRAGRNKLQSSNNLQAVSLGGVSTLLRPGWWAGPHLRAVIGAPERHVVCGARESTSAAAATCGYYGDVRGNARPNSVANEMYQFLMRVNKAMGRKEPLNYASRLAQ
ncbi:hypothetical protein Bbelb_229770 [Branchiostoma belcheri]|nr:hypothetical protein Bbelb_229770 [Branchiostoma belcheri]